MERAKSLVSAFRLALTMNYMLKARDESGQMNIDLSATFLLY